jgi:hypothetical protein
MGLLCPWGDGELLWWQMSAALMTTPPGPAANQQAAATRMVRGTNRDIESGM